MLPLTLYFLAQGEEKGLEPVKKAFETLKSNPILILWFYVVSIVCMLGLCLCCVGIFVTAPLAVTIMYVLMAQACGDNKSNGSESIIERIN